MITKIKETKDIVFENTSYMVCRGKLVLMKCKPEEAKFHLGNELTRYDFSYGLVKGLGKYMKPVIISETEDMEPADDVIVNEVQDSIIIDRTRISKAVTWYDVSPYVQKVLLLPEDFTFTQLDAICEGNLKDGDDVYLTCCNLIDETVSDGEAVDSYVDNCYNLKIFPIYTIE